jgi:DNA modification methylase
MMEIPVNQVILGDCREVMRGWPDGCVDMVLTDPPWMISSEVVIHRSMNPIKYRDRKSIVLDFGPWDHFQDEKEYWEFTRGWLAEAARVLKPRGHLITFFDLNKTTPLIEMAGGLGLQMRQHLFWLKENPVPRAGKVDFMVALEHACWFTKGTKSGATFHYELGQQPNYVEAPIPNNPRHHPTEKPVRVLEVWIRYLSNPGDIILDPMCGSGSTLVAAKRLGRRFIGIEKDPKYFEVARRRLAETGPLGERLEDFLKKRGV